MLKRIYEEGVSNFFKRYSIRYYLLILGFLISCEKKDTEDINIHIETISDQDFNYRYEDLKVIYHINYLNQPEYRLKCKLLDNAGYERYTTAEFNLRSSSTSDTLSLKGTEWFGSNDPVEFYNIYNGSYRLQVSLKDGLSNEEFQSNKLALEINKPNPYTLPISNFTISDINGDKYELVELLESKDYVFLFEFATWCPWSQRSVPKVNTIDSLFDSSITILGVEGSGTLPKAPTLNSLKQFMTNRSIEYPVFLRLDFAILNNILHPDNKISFPRFVLINKEKEPVFRQVGYLENLVDSIQYYVNKN